MATRHIDCPVAISGDSLLQDTLLCTFYFIKVKKKKKRLGSVFISIKKDVSSIFGKNDAPWLFLYGKKELAYSMPCTFIAQPIINIYNQQNRSVIFIF